MNNPNKIIKYLNSIPVPRGIPRRAFLITLLGIATVLRLEREAQAAISYFGYPASGADPSTPSYDSNEGGTYWINKNLTFTCPGSGTQTVKELSCYCKYAVSASSSIRLAVYTSDRATLICQGSAAVLIDQAAAGWYGHLTQASITPNPATLTGGTAYVIAVSVDTGYCDLAYEAGNSGDEGYGTTDYTGGFPATNLGAVNDYTRNFCIRCGVEAANTPSHRLSLLGVG
jgi:hypothetical protein